MIAFVQLFGLESHGGGARILRSLLAEAPVSYRVVATSPVAPPALRPGVEVHLPRRPSFGRLEATRLYRHLAHLDRPLGGRFKERLARFFQAEGVTAVHAIPHGLEFWHAFEVAERLGLPYVFSIHDDLPYNLPGIPYLPEAMERLGHVWREADGRVVISEAMGREYSRRYGERPYVVVTDGLSAIAPAPQRRVGLRVYFMGSMHLSYAANFDALFRALNTLSLDDSARVVSLTVRGGFPFPIDPGTVPVHIHPWGSQADVERDLQEADIYLPLPFEERHATFARFSLSTKLVTYVGSGLPILYHGPAEAAAAEVLGRAGAAVMATSLGPEVLAEALQQVAVRAEDVAWRALALARERFSLEDQRRAFWGLLLQATDRRRGTGTEATPTDAEPSLAVPCPLPQDVPSQSGG